MAASKVVFHRFGDFPTELRLAIWRQCLPQRVVELDSQPSNTIWAYGPPCSGNSMIQLRNKAPPLITRVCRESRQVAFETGRQLPGFPDPDDPNNTQQFTMHMVNHPWLDAARDVVHVNWDAWTDNEWETYDWGDPLRCVVSYAAQTELQRASIRIDFLKYMGWRLCDNPIVQYRWTPSELANLMRAQAPSLSWAVVIRDPVVVHATTAADSGLFGLLGDAPVQLVDATDETRIGEFLSLGNRPGVTISPNFELGELANGKQVLQDMVNDIIGAEESAPAMHPVIMFRLCTQECV